MRSFEVYNMIVAKNLKSWIFLMKKLARLTFVTSATSSGQTMNDRKLSEVKINDDFHKLSPDKGILKIGPQTAEIGRGGLEEPPPQLASPSRRHTY